MRLHILFYLLLALITQVSLGQGADIELIRQDRNYYSGMGHGSNYRSARRHALEALSESISLRIQSEFKQVVIEDDLDLETYTKSVINTYSDAVLNEWEEIVIKEEPDDVEVFVYISRESLSRVFNERKKTIDDFIMLAANARDDLRISDALRYYYWALVLARSHPDNTSLRHDFGGERAQSVLLGLDDRINSIFRHLDVSLTGIRECDRTSTKRFYLTIKYRGQPVQDIDYTYWIGRGYSSLISTRDGIGVVTLDGAYARDANDIRLRLDYEYANKARLEPEVEMMIESVDIPTFRRSEIRVSLREDEEVVVLHKPERAIRFEAVSTYHPDYEVFQDVVEKIIHAIRLDRHEGMGEHFTQEGMNMYEKLIRSAEVSVIDPEIDTLRIMQIGSDVMVRSVPMKFSYHNNRERFIEQVNFIFNEDNKVNSLSFSLGSVAIDDILSKPDAFGSEEEKFFLIHFMENYKTAFALKRLDYIEAIFDDNAYIIVGHIVERIPEYQDDVRAMYGRLSTREVEYIELEKYEYLNRLRRIFRRNEFINIHFEKSLVRKTQRDDQVYGIQIAQHYHSSTYADKGYLFLMIDMNDTLNPIIYVRTWQPERHEDGSIFGLEDFRF